MKVSIKGTLQVSLSDLIEQVGAQSLVRALPKDVLIAETRRRLASNIVTNEEEDGEEEQEEGEEEEEGEGQEDASDTAPKQRGSDISLSLASQIIGCRQSILRRAIKRGEVKTVKHEGLLFVPEYEVARVRGEGGLGKQKPWR